MNYKVLVIEDDESINDILTTSLLSEKYIVKSTFTGNEGRKLINEFMPDLILLDVNLPDDNGFEICKYINSEE